MQDTALYQHLLGLQTPWTVSRVGLDVKEQRVDVWAEHSGQSKWECPRCSKALALYDHAEERTWRHLDSCQFQTYLHARIPRVECDEHGVLQVAVSWAEPRSRFTILFERLAIDVLSQCDVTGATRILRISWDEAWGLMKRAVKRGQRRKEKAIVRRIGVDEKSTTKGQRYLTMVCNLERATVEYISWERTEKSLEEYYLQLTKEQLAGIDAVAMDMWQPYINATVKFVPEGREKIVFDRYHVMTFLNHAVDTVRKRENRELMERGDDTLKGSRYLWLYGRENIPKTRQERFAGLITRQLKVGRAWAIKEMLRDLWHFVDPVAAAKFWKKWYFWATHSRLAPIQIAAKTLKRRIYNILTYFKRPITNAVSEGINGKIQTIKKMANGFRNMENFKTAIYFHCGGLQLHPC